MQGERTVQLYLLPVALPRWHTDGVPMSDVSLPAMQRRSGVDSSKQVLGVLAAEEMLDRAASLPPRGSGPLLLLLLAVVYEGLQSLTTSESEDESEEKRRESVRPASATRRRLRSAVPSRLHAQLLDHVTWLKLNVMHAACSMQQGLWHQEEGLLLRHSAGLYRSSRTCDGPSMSIQHFNIV